MGGLTVARKDGRGRGERPRRRYYLRDPLEGALAYLLFGLLRMLPVDRASALGARIGRAVGRRARRGTSRALANLAEWFPDWPEDRRRSVVESMWDHLGRVIAELPSVDRLIAGGRVDIQGMEHVPPPRSGGRPILFFSGHVGHWELAPPAAVAVGYPVHVIYRPPSNRFIDRLLMRLRSSWGVGLLPKNVDGAKAAVRLMSSGQPFGFLIDENTNRRVPVPFFGPRDPSATAIVNLARFALAHNAVLVPIQVIRIGGARFRLVCHPPMDAPQSLSRDDAVAAIVDWANRHLERWVLDHPEQWLWLLRRPPRDAGAVANTEASPAEAGRSGHARTG